MPRTLRSPGRARLAVAVLAAGLTLAAVSPAAAKPGATTTTASSTSTTSTTATAVAADTAATPAYAHRMVETFDSPYWFQNWGIASVPQRTGIVSVGGSLALGVKFSAGTHDGSTWMFPTGTADDVHLRYRIRFPMNFDPSYSASDVKIPGFGNPVRDAAGECLSGCGGFPADGVTSYSARSDMNADGRPGFYVYHADMAQTTPAYGWGLRWNGFTAGRFTNGQWYTIDLRIRMNTPGVNDGILQASVDGQPVFDGRTFDFRTVDTLHVGNAWFDFHFGGSGVVAQDTIVVIDDVLVEW